jgi:hypothetical protein
MVSAPHILGQIDLKVVPGLELPPVHRDRVHFDVLVFISVAQHMARMRGSF